MIGPRATVRRGSRWNLSRDEYLKQVRLFCARGEDMPNSKLDAAKVKEIRATAKEITAEQWASRLGLHRRTIDKVRQYESWKHVR